MPKLLSFLALLALAAPLRAEEPGAPLRALQALDQRVATIGHRIALANREICPKVEPVPGFSIHALDQYDPKARKIVAATFGFTDTPVVLLVAPGSAAERAGLKVGDRIAAMAGQTLAAAPSKKRSYARIKAFEERLESLLAQGPVDLIIAGDGQARTITLQPETGCASRVQLIPARRLNASADGTYAQLTTGIVAFAKNDDELALIVAHEMAHNILGHRARLDAQNVSRGLLKTFDGSAGKIKVTEKEADYLALYLMARAGFDIGAAPGFWDRYGRAMGPGFLSDGTHPGRGARMEAAKRAIAEIQAKQAAGQPLVPELPVTAS
ncbi:peptidase M48, Ste24p [Allosphingosinicella flava]|uniref:Peptidase M48, Ste24p n=1 Tax=Allosphingosinicella flava TaxID=2771430 RepID=A0A7T2LLF6_9SPHN|nr:M48 family metallopeptidase [Sphingosinicella flava]QPQ54446.1 peptidase M48, Ste24p [Sphingosinicella flava]